jgi:hypothetical protein
MDIRKEMGVFGKTREYPWDKKSGGHCAKIVLKKCQKEQNR